MIKAAYQFLDYEFLLESDSLAFLERFDCAYGQFKTLLRPNLPTFSIQLQSSPPSITLDHQTYLGQDAETLDHYAYNAILNATTSQVRSHFLIHAAALNTIDKQGVMITGRSGLGKTTLSLALLKRGFGCLSDDIAAIGITDHWLHPFPRSLAVRQSGMRTGEKHFIPVEEFIPGGAGEACPLKFLFVLDEEKTSLTDDPRMETCYLTIDRVETKWLESLCAIKGIYAKQVVRGEQYPAVRLTFDKGRLPEIEPKIVAACQQYQILLFEVSRGPEKQPDFTQPPCLIPLSVSQAALHLLKAFKGGPHSALLREDFGGSSTQLYLAFARLAANLTCYQLRVGQLETMIQFILQTVKTI